MPAKKKTTPSLFAPKQDSSKKSKNDTVQIPEIATEIDQYVSLNREIKDLEGRQEILKSKIMQSAREMHGQRLASGEFENFKIAGTESSVSLIAQNSSSILSVDDLENAKSECGEIVEDLVELDYSSIKLNNELFSQYADKISAALTKALGQEIAMQLFSAPGYKVKSDVLKQISELDIDAEQADAMVSSLKIKRYIKA
jgi:hypothetical protein